MTKSAQRKRADGGEAGWDLRLAPMAVGCWAAALATLHAGLQMGFAISGFALLAGGVVWRFPRWRWVIASAVIGLICGAGVTMAHLSIRDSPVIGALVSQGTTASVELEVTDDPRASLRDSSWLIPANLLRVDAGLSPAAADGGEVVGKVKVLVVAGDDRWRGLLPGQKVRATVRFGRAREGELTAAVLEAKEAPEQVGEAPWVQRVAGGLRAGLQRAAEPLDDRPGGLLPGLVVGDTSRLDRTLQDQFRQTGMTHLCAVSGSNVAIVVGCIILIARWCRLSPRATAVAGAIALAGFVVLVRPSASVVRAAAMGSVGLLALAGGRKRAAVPALGASIIVLLMMNPALASDAGFTLSVCATAGLLFIASPMRDALRRKGFPPGIAEAIAVPASAQLACGPVIAGLSGSVSLVAVPANLLAIPAVAPATLIGVAATIVAPLWADGAQFAAWLASWPAWWLVRIAEVGSQTPGAAIAWPGGVAGALILAGISVLGVLCVKFARLRRATVAIGLAVAAGLLPIRMTVGSWPPDGWIVVSCDVGQGDSTVLNAGGGAAVVIDAGPQAKPVSECLSRLDIRVVAVLFVTHFHADHIGGIEALVKFHPSQVITTAFTEPAMGARDVSEKLPGARKLDQAMGLAVGEMNLQVLYTNPLTGTRSDPNNNSLVILATIHGTKILLMGDAETEEQEQIRERYPGLSAEVLKVAHHGSSYQDSQLLAQIHPRIALVSVGKGNVYGHPSASVLASIQRGGAVVARTDEDGDIAVLIANGQLVMVAHGTSG